MKILAIDTTSSVASVAVSIDDTLSAEYTLNHGLTHSKFLLSMIDEVLSRLGLTLSDMDYFAVANGPGSFTGLRIGIATVKGLAFAENKPVIAVSTLEAMAYNYSHSDYVICPLMDARAGQVYTALYKRVRGNLKEILPPQATEIENILSAVSKYKKVLFLGDGVKPNFEILESFGPTARFGEFNNNMQRASSIALLARKKALLGDISSSEELVPQYLRLSQAEREAKKKGK